MASKSEGDPQEGQSYTDFAKENLDRQFPNISGPIPQGLSFNEYRRQLLERMFPDPRGSRRPQDGSARRRP